MQKIAPMKNERNKMKQYNKILRTKRLYECSNCMAFYENRQRAENCHAGNVGVFEVSMKRLKDYFREKDN